MDSDGDGLTDAEERWLGLDPTTNHSERSDSTDLQRVTAGLSAPSVVTLGVLDSRMSERWPSPGVVVVRRSGGLKPITVSLAFGGTAVRGVNYSTSMAGGTLVIPAGVREVPVLLNPLLTTDTVPTETIIITLQSGAAYALGAATTPSGYYPLDQFALAHLEDPMNSPSVFHFFRPTHSPSGPITQQGLVAPEFQIINASSAVSGANYFWNHTLSDLHYWGTANPNYAVKLNLNDELAFLVPTANVNDDVPAANLALDPDPLLRRLDHSLTGGALTPRQFQIIREAMLRIGPGTWQWHRERLRMAIYLITTSAEFNVLR